jgi:hypothetical protein
MPWDANRTHLLGGYRPMTVDQQLRHATRNRTFPSQLYATMIGDWWVESGPLVIGHTDNVARRSCPTSLPRNGGSSYSEKARMEIL